MKIETKYDLLTHELQDLCDAEKQITEALPEVIENCSHEELSEGLENHLEETEEQIARLHKVCENLGIEIEGKTCKGMEGILEEGSKALKIEDAELKDMAIIGGCAKVEHYEMSAYTSTIGLLKALGYTEEVELLEKSLKEEINAATKLESIQD